MAVTKMASKKCLTYKEKIHILGEVDAGLKSKEQIAKENGIKIGYVYSIIRTRAEILSRGAQEKRRISGTQYQDIEEELLCWLRESQEMGIDYISGPMLKEKAIEIAIRLEQYKFPASNGWLMNFRKRYQLTKGNQIPEEVISQEEQIADLISPETKKRKLAVTDDPTIDDAREAQQLLVKFFSKRSPVAGTFLSLQQIGEAIEGPSPPKNCIFIGRGKDYLAKEVYDEAEEQKQCVIAVKGVEEQGVEDLVLEEDVEDGTSLPIDPFV